MIDFFIQLFSQTNIPEASDLAMKYHHSDNIMWILRWVWILAIPVLFLFTGLSKKLGTLSERLGKNLFFSLLIYLIGFVTFYQLLTLPLEFYGSYLREHAYGFSTQTLGRWLGNFGKLSTIILLTSIAFIWIFYTLLKKSPKRWWVYSSLTTIGIIFTLTFVIPILVDPLFNKFGPMKNKQLEKQILDLASKAGIEDTRIFEVDKSKDTKLGNAYVAGIGSSKRIVLWDTIIKPNHLEETLFIVGHEMGHYVLNHAQLWIIYYTIVSFLIFYLTYKTAHFLLFRYQNIFRFKTLHDIASLPLLFCIISFFILLQTPLKNSLSRYMERQADCFGVEITQNNEAAATSFAKAAQEMLLNPRPGLLHKIWRGSHPSVGDRFDFCNSYHPWKTGQPLEYDKHFKAEEKK